MQQESYIKWQPDPELDSPPVIERIVDEDSGLNVVLRLDDKPDQQLILRFESAVAYRNINESYRLRTWAEFGSQRWIGGCYTVSNSRWVRWLKQEAKGVLDQVSLMHYSVFTDEDCVEVVTEFPPDVEWREEGTDSLA